MSESKKIDVCNFPSTITECENQPHKPNLSIGKVVSKVPVVLAELTVQVNLDACIKFPEPVLEIKDVKKHVKLVQCRLLLPPINYLSKDSSVKISNMQALVKKYTKVLINQFLLIYIL